MFHLLPAPAPAPISVAVYTACARVANAAKNPSIRNRAVYVAVLHEPGQRLRDVRQARAYWSLGTADSRYRGPRAAYGQMIREAEHLAALVLDSLHGVASDDQLAQLRGYGPPVAGWPRSRAALRVEARAALRAVADRQLQAAEAQARAEAR